MAFRDHHGEPVGRVQLPKMREMRKERVTLVDEELTQLVTADQVDAELKMLSVCSRVLGGMRAGDLDQLVWEKLDPPNFTEVGVPRSKTKTPQRLGVPEEVRPIIKAWWEQHGSPTTGPVFPSRRGDRKGLAKVSGSSYARRLRKELRRAGLTRPELFTKTSSTLPVDFHSFRRSFVGALSSAGVNLQRSMKLSGHTSAQTHAGYIVGVQQIPRAIIPAISARKTPPVAPLGRAAAGHGDPENPNDSEEKEGESSARHTGFEPVAYGFGGRILHHEHGAFAG
jgi:integrase